MKLHFFEQYPSRSSIYFPIYLLNTFFITSGLFHTIINQIINTTDTLKHIIATIIDLAPPSNTIAPRYIITSIMLLTALVLTRALKKEPITKPKIEAIATDK